jgi:acyl carrier protein
LRRGTRYIILLEAGGETGKIADGSPAAIRGVGIYTALETRYMCADNPGKGTPGRSSHCCKPEESGVSVEEKVIGIVSEQLQIPKEEIAADKSFVDDLKADSLDVVELVMEFEDQFKITIPDEDYEKIKTVGDAVKYIEEKQ